MNRAGRDAGGALLSRPARPLRFAITGGTAAAFQLASLQLLVSRDVPGIPANVAAFLLAAQINFTLSRWFTWHDRRLPLTGRALIATWLAFHCSIAMGALLNLTTFLVARDALAEVAAAALGIAVGAVVNFTAGDRLIFAEGR